MANIFSTPNKKENYQSHMVYVLTVVWSVITACVVSVGFAYFPHLWLRWLSFVGISAFIGIVNLFLNYRGHTRLAGWSLVTMLWLYVTIPAYTSGGMSSPGILIQLSVVLTAGLLFGRNGGLAIGLLTVGVDLGLALLETNGYLPRPAVVHTPMSRWITAIIPFGSVLAIQHYATKLLNASMLDLQLEVERRKESEKLRSTALWNLEERVKELKSLYAVSRILQHDDAQPTQMYSDIAVAIASGWQHPELTAVRIMVGEVEYHTSNYRHTEYNQFADTVTQKGTRLEIEVVYLQVLPDADEGPFLHEERNLLNMLLEMLETDLDAREHRAELQDYKYAIDIASIVSISNVDGKFTFVNENFCKTSQYTEQELLGNDHSILWSGEHTPEHFLELGEALRKGKPYRGEFRNKARDGSLYWVDTSIVPFLDKNGNIYQFLSINYDITERKEAAERLRRSEELLKKVTSQVPANTYMFTIDDAGRARTLFFNRGSEEKNHGLDLNDPDASPKVSASLHDDDKEPWNNEMKRAYRTHSPISIQYRIRYEDEWQWRWFRAVPEIANDGSVVWYGAAHDITPIVDYIVSIEQMIFDTSHVIRRPIASMMGMTSLLIDGNRPQGDTTEVFQNLHSIAAEIDDFIKELIAAYNEKRKTTTFNIDTSALIDKRRSFFRR